MRDSERRRASTFWPFTRTLGQGRGAPFPTCAATPRLFPCTADAHVWHSNTVLYSTKVFPDVPQLFRNIRILQQR
jgi:hypothetical protein